MPDKSVELRLILSGIFLMNDFDTAVLLCPGVADGRATVRRAVVYQNDLQVFVRLRSNGCYTAVKVGFHFINWNDHADQIHKLLLTQHDISCQRLLLWRKSDALSRSLRARLPPKVP